MATHAVRVNSLTAAAVSDRRLLLQAECGRWREAANHGLHRAGVEVKIEISARVLRRPRRALITTLERWKASHRPCQAKRADPARVLLETGRRVDILPTAERVYLGRLTRCRREMNGPTGKAT